MVTKKSTASKATKKIAASPPPLAETSTGAAAVPRPSEARTEALPPVSLAPSAPLTTKVSKEERHRMIAEAAYYISLRRGPSSDPLKNWLEAEAQIDAQLKRDGRV